MVAAALLALLFSGALKLLGSTATGGAQASEDELADQLTRIGASLATLLERAGAAIDDDGDRIGVPVCALAENSDRCTPFTPTAQSVCMGLPLLSNNKGLNSVELYGIRHRKGALEQRVQGSVNMQAFSLNQFCRDHTDWKRLHSPAELEITAIRLCKFDASQATGLLADYSQSCPSILIQHPATGERPASHWIMMLKAKSGQLGHQDVPFNRIVRLYNKPNVTTPP